MANENEIFVNGLNARTGDYLTKTTPAEIAKMALNAREATNKATINDLQRRNSLVNEGSFRIARGESPEDLAQAGWGIIFAAVDNAKTDAIKAALAPLIAHRQAQAGDRFRIYDGADGYLPGQSKLEFLSKKGVDTTGSVDPEKMPYYLLIVADPATIPYQFQYQLDVQYSVGRIYFETHDEYAYYAQSVVATEKGETTLPRKASFFSVANNNDRATNLSHKKLTTPLVGELKEKRKEWAIDLIQGEATTKDKLGRLLGGEDTPSLLFTSTHGIGFPNGDDRQLSDQGGLVTNNWGGPYPPGPITEDLYFAGNDLSQNANVHGLIHFCFACYGAGTPAINDFDHLAGEQSGAIAPKPFIANLPSKLLAHPKGGALAFIGHVERAWTNSFSLQAGASEIGSFKETLDTLMLGAPVGYALESFNERYAEVATELTTPLNDYKAVKELGFVPKPEDEIKISRLWTAHNDARSYVIIGDPAVRLPLAKQDEEATGRATIHVISPTISATTPQVEAVVAKTTTEVTSVVMRDGTANIDFSDAQPESFGLFDRGGLKEVQEQLTNALKELTKRVSDAIGDTIDNASNVTVETYVSDDLNSVTWDRNSKTFTNAERRVLSQMGLGGDTRTVLDAIPRDGDTELIDLHNKMVDRATQQRQDVQKMLVSVAMELVNLGK